MEFSLSTSKNRASTYCTSLSLTVQIKCIPITQRREEADKREREQTVLAPLRDGSDSLSAKESFSLTRLGNVSCPQSYCTLEQSHQGHEFLLFWPPPLYNPPAQVSKKNKAADLDSISPSTAHIMSINPAQPAAPLWAMVGSLFNTTWV